MRPDSILHDKCLPGLSGFNTGNNNLDSSGCTYGQRQNTNLTNNPVDVVTTIDLNSDALREGAAGGGALSFGGHYSQRSYIFKPMKFWTISFMDLSMV